MAPLMILMSVDLPAPLAPTIPWMVAGRTCRSTSVRAWVPLPKTLESPRASRIGCMVSPGRSVMGSGFYHCGSQSAMLSAVMPGMS